MFTGIIEDIGIVKGISRGKTSFSMSIESHFDEVLKLGESIAVNGVCLTVASFSGSVFSVDVTPETFSRTSLKDLSSGSLVNLERAMMADGRFGGHIVSGHIDGTARIVGMRKVENSVNVQIAMEKKLGEYMIEKGSVAIDGISLTIASLKWSGSDCVITLAVIPHTFENTILSKKRNGQVVNIECDMISKYVRHFMVRDKD